MKIWLLLSQGIGNVCETIPLYQSLIKAGHTVDVTYIKEYKNDRVNNMWFYPCEVMEELNPEEVNNRETEQYDWIIRPPLIYKCGEFCPPIEYLDEMRELDSEVVRNNRIADYLKIPIDWDCKITMQKPKKDLPDKFIVAHNGSQEGWDRKKYPNFPALCALIQKNLGLPVVSIGAKSEHIWGTVDYTGHRIRETAYIINRSVFYVGTDTGTYHIAAALKKPGVAIFTCTSIAKNWDKDFHNTISPIQLSLDCLCQRSYHWLLHGANCRNWKCQNHNPLELFKLVEKRLG